MFFPRSQPTSDNSGNIYEPPIFWEGLIQPEQYRFFFVRPKRGAADRHYESFQSVDVLNRGYFWMHVSEFTEFLEKLDFIYVPRDERPEKKFSIVPVESEFGPPPSELKKNEPVTPKSLHYQEAVELRKDLLKEVAKRIETGEVKPSGIKYKKLIKKGSEKGSEEDEEDIGKGEDKPPPLEQTAFFRFLRNPDLDPFSINPGQLFSVDENPVRLLDLHCLVRREGRDNLVHVLMSDTQPAVFFIWPKKIDEEATPYGGRRISVPRVANSVNRLVGGGIVRTGTLEFVYTSLGR